MPSMLSYPRRLPSGHFTCYLIRTYHVLTTDESSGLTLSETWGKLAGHVGEADVSKDPKGGSREDF